MANSKLNDGLGKKIVDALKKQSEVEIIPMPAESDAVLGSDDLPLESLDFKSDDDFFFDQKHSEPVKNDFSFEQSAFSSMDFGASEVKTPNSAVINKFAEELNNFEIPGNIAVLKKLISQLPSGVTRQTGAQIIRQTMEALGISMKSVLQEAQQIQEGLKESAKECHATIQDYKKQILVLEKQSQTYQKQYGALNDLISLFIQTSN